MSGNSEIDNSGLRPRSGAFNNPWTAWLIVAIIVLPMLAAYAIYKTGFGIPHGTVNKGDLLLPATAITSLGITDENGRVITLPGEHKIWRILLVGSNDCDQTCQDLLYVSRQIHVRLGDKAHRIERLYLNTDPGYSESFHASLAAEHPLLIRAHVNAQRWQQLFKNTSIGEHKPLAHHLYLVDQQGFAMMSYSKRNEGGEMLDDIKRLLKYSYEE